MDIVVNLIGYIAATVGNRIGAGDEDIAGGKCPALCHIHLQIGDVSAVIAQMETDVQKSVCLGNRLRSTADVAIVHVHFNAIGRSYQRARIVIYNNHLAYRIAHIAALVNYIVVASDSGRTSSDGIG